MVLSEEKLYSLGRRWVYIFNRRKAKKEIPVETPVFGSHPFSVHLRKARLMLEPASILTLESFRRLPPIVHKGNPGHNPIPIANQGQYPVWAAGSGDKLCRQNCAEDDPEHHGGQEAAADTWKQNVDTPPPGSVYPKSQAAGSSWRTTPDTGCCWCFTGTWPDCRAGNTCRSCDGTRGS